MWEDNETEIDFLGFDFLVDSLLVAHTEPRLLPLTAGALGDWVREVGPYPFNGDAANSA